MSGHASESARLWISTLDTTCSQLSPCFRFFLIFLYVCVHVHGCVCVFNLNCGHNLIAVLVFVFFVCVCTCVCLYVCVCVCIQFFILQCLLPAMGSYCTMVMAFNALLVSIVLHFLLKNSKHFAESVLYMIQHVFCFCNLFIYFVFWLTLALRDGA